MVRGGPDRPQTDPSRPSGGELAIPGTGPDGTDPSVASAPRPLAASTANIDRVLRVILQVVATASVLIELVVVLANLVDRELLGGSISWNIAASEIALVVVGFVGGALAYLEGRDIRIDVLLRRLSPGKQRYLDAAADWVAAGVAAVVLIWVIQSYSSAQTATIPGLSVSEGDVVIVMAGGMAAIVVIAALRLCRYRVREIGIGAVPAAVVVAIVAVLARVAAVNAISAGSALLLAALLAVAMLFIGTPVGFSLLLLPVTDMLASGTATSFLPTQLEAGLTSYILLAIPFFVFAGYLLTEGGLGAGIIDMLTPVLKRAPGGLLQLAIGTMFVFSGMSGAKIADVAAVGTALEKPLADEGYSPGEVAAVLSACASAGEVIPPSIAMLILGSITSLSIGTLFVAGIIPAIFVGLCLAVLAGIRDKRGLVRTGPQGTETPPWSVARVGRGLLALGMPVVLVGGIESGIITPTESGAVAVVYALVVGLCFRGGLNGRKILKIAEHSAAMSGMLLLLIAVASAVAASLAIAQVPQDVASGLAALGKSPAPMLLLTILIMPIAGAVLEGIPAILVFGPLLVPTAINLGFNGVQYGIVFILAMGIGAFSPLLGIGFFTAAKVVKADVSDATRRYLWYFVALVVATLVVAFVPQLTSFLPHLLGLTDS